MTNDQSQQQPERLEAPERHTHNCPNCFHFFQCNERECSSDYSKCCDECWERKL